jgi:hypothetical protein
MCQKNNNFRSADKIYSTESLLVMPKGDKENMSLAMRKSSNESLAKNSKHRKSVLA